MDDTPYMQLIRRNTDVCTPVCTFSRKAIQLTPPANKPLADSMSLKWKYRLVAAGNKKGFEQYFPMYDSYWYRGFKYDVNNTLPLEENQTIGTDWEKYGESSSVWNEGNGMGERRWQRKACARFSRKQEDTKTQIHTPPPLAYQQDQLHPLYDLLYGHQAGDDPLDYFDLLRGNQTMVQQAIATQGDLPELAHDHTAFLYTDGSRLKEVPNGAPGIGAAVYNPKTRSVTSVEVAWDGEAADTKSNTINRAELVGLLIAMRQGDECRWHDGSIHIATDSLASIYAIAKALTRPQDVNEHRHLSILKEIIQDIRNAPGQVHIHKVMAHTGIIGNEIADQAAVRLASGEDIADTRYDSPSNSRSDMHWPHQVSQKQTNTGQVITCVSPIADMGDTFKTAVTSQTNMAKPATMGCMLVRGPERTISSTMSQAARLSTPQKWDMSTGNASCSIGGGCSLRRDGSAK
jgi:ribonuclease HI